MTDSPLDLALPAIFRRLLRYVAGLSDEEFSRFGEAMSALAPSLPTEEVTDRLLETLPEGEGRSVTGLLEFATSTRRLATSLTADVETVARAVARAYLATDEDPSSHLEGRVLALLNNQFITVREKAQTLAGEGSAIVTDAKCITDLRPVFASNVTSDEVSGMLIIHNLKLEVEGADPIFLMLDYDRLDLLIGVLRRAADKARRLSQLLDDSKVRNLTIRSDK